MKSVDEFLDQILSGAPSSETVFLLLERQKAEGKVDTVIRECIKALGRYPRDARIRGLLAEACYERGWLTRAESEAERATAELEDLVPVYKLKARIYSSLNRPEEAARCLEIYLAHRPEERESLAPSRQTTPVPEAFPSPLGDVEERIETAPGVSPYPTPEIATPTLAELYFAQGQVQEAVSTYEKVVAQHPEAEQSRTRLEELKAVLAPPPPVRQADPDAERARNRKMKLIHALETWKESLQVQ